MQIQLTPYHARMVANNIDYNRNGKIESRELKFKNNSKRMVDYDRNGRVSTEELAYSLMRGDIYIAEGRKAYPTYNYGGYPRPGYGTPGYGNPGYGTPPYRYGPDAPLPQQPGFPYGQGNSSGGGIGKILGTTVVGAGAGAAIGYAINPVQKFIGGGAAIGAIIGVAVGALLNRD